MGSWIKQKCKRETNSGIQLSGFPNWFKQRPKTNKTIISETQEPVVSELVENKLTTPISRTREPGFPKLGKTKKKQENSKEDTHPGNSGTRVSGMRKGKPKLKK